MVVIFPMMDKLTCVRIPLWLIKPLVEVWWSMQADSLGY
jgi:hypothetical protein